jgi:hypothetical protein
MISCKIHENILLTFKKVLFYGNNLLLKILCNFPCILHEKYIKKTLKKYI